MNLNQLYYFKKVAELKHFTKAAQELHISQPSLSYSIASLEKELGTSLFNKNGRRISLSKSGEEFLKYANASLYDLEKGIKIIKKNTNIEAGKIEVGYISTIASKFLPKLTKEYLETFDSQTNFNFYSSYTSEIIKGVNSGKFDVGFCSYTENEPDLVFFPVLNQELSIIVPKEHELSKNNILSLKEVSKHPIITYNVTSNSLGILIMNIFDSQKIHPNIVYELNDETSIGGFVSQGFGVGIVVNLPLLKQFDLDIIPLDINIQTRIVYCVYNKKYEYTKAIQSYIKFLKQKQIALYNN